MSNENGETGRDSGGRFRDHPLRIAAATATTTIFLCFLVSQQWYGATLDLKNAKISSLEQEKKDYKRELGTLQAELDSLRRLVGADSEGDLQRETLPAPGGRYVGSTQSNRYHRPSCVHAGQILPRNRTWFEDREYAQSRGYVPCGVCNP